MREVKFRAWRESSLAKYMDYEPTLQAGHASSIFVNEAIQENQYPLMQYTGLKDKNGREIYEGDVVRFVDFDSSGGRRADREITGVIKYQSGLYEIWNNNESEFFESDGAFILNHAWLQDEEFEVIGNIYENPELLEAK